jgi:hypothetical protein
MNNTESTQHTPTPWQASPVYSLTVDGARLGDHVATLCGPRSVASANQALILTACNAWHDPAALRARLAELEGKK